MAIYLWFKAIEFDFSKKLNLDSLIKFSKNLIVQRNTITVAIDQKKYKTGLEVSVITDKGKHINAKNGGQVFKNASYMNRPSATNCPVIIYPRKSPLEKVPLNIPNSTTAKNR